MYNLNDHAAHHSLSSAQHISLDKHQCMIDGALRWQQACKFADEAPKSAAIPRLRTIPVALVHLIAG